MNFTPKPRGEPLQGATTDRQRFLAREDVDMLNSRIELVQCDTVA